MSTLLVLQFDPSAQRQRSEAVLTVAQQLLSQSQLVSLFCQEQAVWLGTEAHNNWWQPLLPLAREHKVAFHLCSASCESLGIEAEHVSAPFEIVGLTTHIAWCHRATSVVRL